MELDPNWVKDMVRRTIVNLVYVEGVHAKDENPNKPEVYEVTQLINSMLGTIITPFEYGTVNERDMDWGRHWNHLPLEQGTSRHFRTMGTLASIAAYLRHTFAHGNYTLLPTNGQLTHIELRPEGKPSVRMTIADLRTIVMALAALIITDGASTTLVLNMLHAPFHEADR